MNINTTSDIISNTRSWLLARGFIHPKNVVTTETMESQVELLTNLIADTRKSADLRARAQNWLKVWEGKLNRETKEFGVPSGVKTKGRSSKKAAKSQASRAEYDAKQGGIKKWSKPQRGQR